MKFLILFLLIFKILLFANNTYYQHRVSQFEILSINSNKTIVMLGDSLTDRGLWNELCKREDISNRGISGDTVIGLLGRLDMLNDNVKKAFIMIGVNDLIKNRSVKYIYKNYIKIIEVLQKKGITPIVQSNLYVGAIAPKEYNENIARLNTLMREYTNKNHISYIDLNEVLAPDGYLLNKYSLDGLHLNGKGYYKWVEIIIKFM
jgi:lysophospholipase L1-like esterase